MVDGTWGRCKEQTVVGGAEGRGKERIVVVELGEGSGGRWNLGKL